MSKIPSDEEFERASKLMEADSRNLALVIKNMKNHFGGICPLYEFYLLPQRENKFWAGIFFNDDKDVEESGKNGIQQDIIEFVYSELERVGRGKRKDINVVFEFDSDENVKANYKGDYYLRLR